MTVETAIALNRFGLGARPDEPPPGNPRAWLTRQFALFEASTPLLSALSPMGAIGSTNANGRPAPPRAGMPRGMKAKGEARGDAYKAGVEARATAALTTSAPFIERLVHFWSNHFAISANGVVMGSFAPLFERDAIRPHVLGKFEDMVAAVERHPAMLIYLNQVKSVGPASAYASRRGAMSRRGLNENLAREILELHTLGARSGYTQEDVSEFARALTGWGVGGFGFSPGQDREAEFRFTAEMHEPGPRKVLGKIYAAGGEGQAAAILNDVARSPATARHVASKLARHFVADNPPPSLVNRLEAVFLDSGGDLPSVYAALARSDEAWAPKPAKFKTPWEWTISALRGIGRTRVEGQSIAEMLRQLGQPVWRPGSPAGWDDLAATWASPAGLVRRVELAQQIAARTTTVDRPQQLAQKLLPGVLSEATALQIAAAESAQTAVALLLVSPEFQRR